MTRAEERRRDFLAAQSEKINLNGMMTGVTANPISTRAAEEIRRVAAEPDTESETLSHHNPAAGAASIQYVGNVRERLQRRKAEQEEAATPSQIKSADHWLEYNERYREKYGVYPSHGI